ncbi:hypothetical protein FB567DRAFT_160422 [Paraphoma chrysanthemicola]|uniref:Secreted protein n=1 Tax=Paraphoma chrysanthemicola TaxID=798071 RepID=A0A8K0RDP6_9PLEO|nr:hypothetical protein FB567DRAFT_160422 [Paraphoma chrysanthemicola]
MVLPKIIPPLLSIAWVLRLHRGCSVSTQSDPKPCGVWRAGLTKNMLRWGECYYVNDNDFQSCSTSAGNLRTKKTLATWQYMDFVVVGERLLPLGRIWCIPSLPKTRHSVRWAL